MLTIILESQFEPLYHKPEQQTPVKKGHKFGIPRVVVVHKLCLVLIIIKIVKLCKVLQQHLFYEWYPIEQDAGRLWILSK